ncbi:MAG: glycosyltransferase [Desulfurococcales archaeon]|nr:glycosyltransferase [Desulfurococcales archaeon]
MSENTINSEIVLLTHEYPPYVFGGVATYMENIAEWFSKRGWKVLVIAGRADPQNRLVVKRKGNLTIVRTYFPEIPPRWFIYSLVVRNYLKKMLTNITTSKVILTNGLSAWLILRKLNINSSHFLITVFHGSMYAPISMFKSILNYRNMGKIPPEEFLYFMEAPLHDFLVKKDLDISDYYIFVAQHVSKEFERLYQEKGTKIRERGKIVYPGIEFEYLTKLSQNVKTREKNRNIIAFVGRLFYSKGVFYAVKSIDYLVNELREKDFELWVFGKGPLEPWLENYIKRRNLSRFVKKLGFLPRDKLLFNLAKHVNVLLHPSLYEAAPLTIMESQSLGIPVVTFDLPWSQEFVLEGINGYKAQYPDLTQLSKYLIKATEIEQKKVIRTAKRYDREISFSTLENIIIETLA